MAKGGVPGEDGHWQIPVDDVWKPSEGVDDDD